MFCSVAMSTYNGERFLAEQLSSICAQTRPVDEIVVSDDGSSDGTLRILDDFRLAHPQIHWKILPSAENHGFSRELSARPQGLRRRFDFPLRSG